MTTINKTLLVPPAYAALAFTVPQSLDSMTRPDSIWIPFILEIPLFILSYVIFAVINATSVRPASKFIVARTQSNRGAAIYSIAVASILSFILFLAGIFNKSSIFHSIYFFGSFLPLSIMAFSSFHFSRTAHMERQADLTEGDNHTGES